AEQPLSAAARSWGLLPLRPHTDFARGLRSRRISREDVRQPLARLTRVRQPKPRLRGERSGLRHAVRLSRLFTDRALPAEPTLGSVPQPHRVPLHEPDVAL